MLTGARLAIEPQNRIVFIKPHPASSLGLVLNPVTGVRVREFCQANQLVLLFGAFNAKP